MAEPKEFIVYCRTKASFEAKVASGEVDYTQVGIIAETGEMWWEGEYSRLVDKVPFAESLTGNINFSQVTKETFRKSMQGNIWPMFAPYIDVIRPNHLAFLQDDEYIVETSNDGGASWTELEKNDNIRNLFIGTNSSRLAIDSSPDNLLRITIKPIGRYTQCEWFYLYTSSPVHATNPPTSVTVEKCLKDTPDTWTGYITVPVTGQPAPNIIGLGATQLGGTGNVNYGWRLTFRNTTTSTTKTVIYGIELHGTRIYTAKNNMMKWSHLYGTDPSQNALFPASVQATDYRTNNGGVGLVTDAQTLSNEQKKQVADNLGGNTNNGLVRYVGGVLPLKKISAPNANGVEQTYVFPNASDEEKELADDIIVTEGSMSSFVPELTNFAKDLTGRIEATPEEFTFRPSAGDKSIRDESAVIRRIKGNTSVWNQLAYNGDFKLGTTDWRSSVPANTFSIENGNLVVTTTTETSAGNILQYRTIKKGVYAICAKWRVISEGYEAVMATGFFSSPTAWFPRIAVKHNEWIVQNMIITATQDYSMFSVGPYFYAASIGSVKLPIGAKIEYEYVNVVNLTALYESGNEPTTIEEFKKLYPDRYYPYCAEEIRSMRATGIETIGANAFDKDSVVGGLINDDGSVTLNDAYSVARIEVVPSTKYHLQHVANSYLGIANAQCYTYAFYDSNDTFIVGGYMGDNITFQRSMTGDVTTPMNARYMRVRVDNSYLVACRVIISHTYIPEEATYFKSVRMFPDIAKYFPDGMHGIGDVFDEINEDNAIQRLDIRAYEEGDYDNTNVKTDGSNTVYILEEPIITPITEPLQLDYKVADFGTEKMLSDLPSSPFRADIVYQFNAVDRIRDNARNIERLEEHTKDMATMDYVIEKIPTAIATATQRVTTWPSDNRLVANVLVDMSMGSREDPLSILGFVGGSSDSSFDDVWRIRFAGLSSVLNILPTICWMNGQAPSFDEWAICDIEFRRTPYPSDFIIGEWKIYR